MNTNRKSARLFEGLISLLLVLIVLVAAFAVTFPEGRALGTGGARAIIDSNYGETHNQAGDCGGNKPTLGRYHLPESGAAGYCYVYPGVEATVSTSKVATSEPRETPIVVVVVETTVPSTDTPVVVTPPSTSVPPVVVVTPVPSTPVPPVVVVTEPPTQEPPVVITPEPADEPKQKCNKGEGNGGEGCDPGNHPEKGNDDEDQGKNKKNEG